MNPYNIKVNAVLVAISLVLSCLIGYLAFSIGEGKENDKTFESAKNIY